MGGRSCRDIKEELEEWELGARFEQKYIVHMYQYLNQQV